jgi:hypothetical protein
MRNLLIRMHISAGLSVRREPKRLLPEKPGIRPGDLVVRDWTIDRIQHTTVAMPWISLRQCLTAVGGVFPVLRKRRVASKLEFVLLRRSRKNVTPGEPEARAERGNTYTYTMQERCRRAQFNFWPIAIEVDSHFSCWVPVALRPALIPP